MDPITIALLISAGSATGAGIAWLIKKLCEPEPPPPPPPPPAQAPPPPPPPPPPEPEKPPIVLREAVQQRRDRLTADTIKRIAANVVFSAKRVKAGRRKVGERAIGVVREEVPFPADDFDVRALHDLGELHRALPSETALTDEQFFVRAAAGELMVGVDIQERTIREEIYEDVWEERERRLVIVLDVSPSVFPRYNPWMESVWKGLVLAMIDKSQEAEAAVELQEFDGGDRGRHTAAAKAGYTKLRQHVAEIREGSDTDIGGAVLRAIGRLEKETYDQAELMLVTDGQDNGGVDPTKIRARLEAAHIRLHVVLLGVAHQSLLSCADTYQIVENGPDGPTVGTQTTRR